MEVRYRSAAHAVTGINDKYGYYQSISYRHKRNGELIIQTETTPEKAWPLNVYVKITVRNHEDLTRFTDAILTAFDSLRGEFGEKEVRSPSSVILL